MFKSQFNPNEVLRIVDETLKVELGTPKPYEAYQPITGRTVRLPWHVAPGALMGVEKIGADVECFFFEANSFFDKGWHSWQNPESVHGDYLCDNARRISDLLLTAAMTPNGQDFFRFEKLADSFRELFNLENSGKTVRELVWTDTFFYVNDSSDGFKFPVAVLPGKSMPITGDKRNKVYCFAFRDSTGFFLIDGKGAKTYGKMVATRYKSHSPDRSTAFMTSVSAQLRAVTRLLSDKDVTRVNDAVQIAEFSNEKVKSVCPLYAIAGNPENLSVLKNAFPTEMAALMSPVSWIGQYDGNWATYALTQLAKTPTAVAIGKFSESESFDEWTELARLMKVEASELNGVRELGWRNYFFEQTKNLGTKNSGTFDKMMSDFVRLMAETTFVALSGLRDVRNETFPNREDAEQFLSTSGKFMEKISEHVRSKLEESPSLASSKNRLALSACAVMWKQIRYVTNVKNSDVYRDMYAGAYGIPESEKRSQISGDRRFGRIVSTKAGAAAYGMVKFVVKHFEKIKAAVWIATGAAGLVSVKPSVPAPSAAVGVPVKTP